MLIKNSFKSLSSTFSQVKSHKETLKFLLARLIYNDALITIFAFGGIYAQGAVDFTFQEVMYFGIVLNVAAGLGAFLAGFLDDKIGGKNTIQISNIGLIIACILALFANWYLFWAAGIIIGLCAGPNPF